MKDWFHSEKVPAHEEWAGLSENRGDFIRAD